jgi:hypothetical protein
LLANAQEMANIAVRANSKLNGEFELWGEPLIADHLASDYKASAKRVLDIFGNFQSRFNTVAKLNNFNYTVTIQVPHTPCHIKSQLDSVGIFLYT